jgi:hypothetical protein
MQTRYFSTPILLSLLAAPSLARADFEPIPLTADSFNQDVIVEKTAPPPLVPVTTASMDQGLVNSGFSWFERGYLADWPVNGLPKAGSLLISLHSADHQYQMPPSYKTANAVLIDTLCSNATVTFAAPTNCAALSFLTSSGLSANVLQYTIRYGDRGSETGTFTSPKWYGLDDPAWVANGRVDVKTFSLADLTVYNPRLYSVDVNLTNVLGPVTGVDLSLASGKGHTAIFAISGALAIGHAFQPIPINGFNEDLVVEATALQPGFLDTNTTATMDNGAANTRFTWFEKGYYAPAPESGLPAPGSLIVSESEPGHRFVLPANYADKNGILVDAVYSNAVLTLLTPTACSALSFLTASGHGPLTNQCVIRHADGTFETNRFVSPDWLASEPAALTTHGRVSVSTRLADRINTQGPRLYAVDVPLANTNSPVMKIVLSPLRAGIDTHALVFALSGTLSGTAPTRPALSIAVNADGSITLHSTQSGALQSCVALLGAATVWKDEGTIQQSLTLPIPSGEPARFYRVLSP